MRRTMVIFALSFSLVSAAEASPALTWEDCVRLAARKNPDLLSALRAMEASHAQYKGSYNSLFPHFSLNNSYTDSNRTVSSSFGGAVSNSSEFWQAEGLASLDVFNLADWASIRTASAGYQLTQANLRVSSTNVLLNLYKAFAGMLYAQEEAHVAQSIREIWQKNADMIALRYDSGRESKGNKMRTDAQLLQAQSDLSQSARDLHVSQQNLSQVLGEDQFQALAVTGTWTNGFSPAGPSSMDFFVDHSPRILAQTAVVNQAQAALLNAHSTLWPTLSLNYNRGYQANREFPTTNPFWVFTGEINLPVFSGGPTAAYYAGSAAQRTLEKSQQDLRSIRNQVRSDLESAWSGLLQAQEQFGVQSAFLEAANQRRRESDVRYESGLMPFEEWELVVIDLVNFEKSYLRSEQNLVLAQAQWRFAKGEQLGESL